MDWPLALDSAVRPKEAEPAPAWAVRPKDAEPAPAWTVRFASGVFECPHVLLASLGDQALSGFTSSPAGGPEVGGVLYGACADNYVRAGSHRMLNCEHERGPQFDLSRCEEEELKSLLADPASSLRPIGWYFSQYQSLRLNPGAMALHERYFPEPWQVILVFERSRTQPLRVGLFARSADGSLNPKPLQVLTMEPDWRIRPSRETGPLYRAGGLRRIS